MASPADSDASSHAVAFGPERCAAIAGGMVRGCLPGNVDQHLTSTRGRRADPSRAKLRRTKHRLDHEGVACALIAGTAAAVGATCGISADTLERVAAPP